MNKVWFCLCSKHAFDIPARGEIVGPEGSTRDRHLTCIRCGAQGTPASPGWNTQFFLAEHVGGRQWRVFDIAIPAY
jgi:hypothetical protein